MNLINPMNEWSIAIASSEDIHDIYKCNSHDKNIVTNHHYACECIIEAIDKIDGVPQVIKDRYKNLLIVDLDSHDDEDYNKIKKMCARRIDELHKKEEF